jgi:hypothetical protein
VTDDIRSLPSLADMLNTWFERRRPDPSQPGGQEKPFTASEVEHWCRNELGVDIVQALA